MYNLKDFYTKKAKKNKIKARSYFKLEEIDKKFNLIKKKQKILDIGCHPGSWSQYCFKKTNNDVHIVGIDLIKTNLNYKNFFFIQENILNITNEKIFFSNNSRKEFDGIICDAAPRTTGIKSIDCSQSYKIVSQVISIEDKILKAQGFIIVKYFYGEEINDLKDQLNNIYFIKLFKPKSSRKNSKEVFIIIKKK